MCDRMIDEIFEPEAEGTFPTFLFVDGFPLHFTPIYVLLTLRPVCYFSILSSCPLETVSGSLDQTERACTCLNKLGHAFVMKAVSLLGHGGFMRTNDCLDLPVLIGTRTVAQPERSRSAEPSFQPGVPETR